MREIHIRQWMVILLSGILQQPVGHVMNPLGIAYFAAAYMWPEHRTLLPVVTLIGMAVSVPQNLLLKYLGILIGVMLITYILEWKKAWVSQREMLLMLSLLILSADMGYGLAAQGVSLTAFLSELRLGCFEAVFSALTFFMFYKIMKNFLKEIKSQREAAAQEKEEMDFVQYRLGDMAAAFRKISHMMSHETDEVHALTEDELGQVFSDVTENMCAQCGRRSQCWENEYADTSCSAYHLLQLCTEQGYIEKQQIPSGFRRRCVHLDNFLQETHRALQMASTERIWQNRLNENRLAFAGQIGEIAEIIDDLSLELSERKEDTKKLSEQLRQGLSERAIRIKKLSVTDEGQQGRHQKIYIMAKTRWGQKVSTRQLAEWTSTIARQRFVPEKGTPEALGKAYEVVELTEDTKYRIVQGIARSTKDGENVSGDSYAFVYLDSGQVLMSLSDGMGSGEKAREDSEFMINLLEQMVDTGFGRQSALRLLNAIMMSKTDKQMFSSMDLSVIDLYSGICEFIKIGASSTFIKRGENVECVTSGSLPMGVFPELDCEGVSRNLFDGDVIVMVTDGVVNRFPKGNDALCRLISEIPLGNPNVMAEEILNQALDMPEQGQPDDMTVLVCTVCKKSAAMVL